MDGQYSTGNPPRVHVKPTGCQLRTGKNLRPRCVGSFRPVIIRHRSRPPGDRERNRSQVLPSTDDTPTPAVPVMTYRAQTFVESGERAKTARPMLDTEYKSRIRVALVMPLSLALVMPNPNTARQKTSPEQRASSGDAERRSCPPNCPHLIYVICLFIGVLGRGDYLGHYAPIPYT